MSASNWSQATEFILLGLTEDPRWQIPFFLFFLLVYMFTILGNVGIITLISVSHHLHTPMYFFLCNLSFIDIMGSSIIVPKMLVNILSENPIISFPACTIQTFLIFAFGSAEVFLLPVMAYDRYTAICNPLLYSVTMNNASCVYFIVFIYALAICNALIQTVFTFTLPFCKSNKINHFFCDVPAIMKISCADTSLNEVILVSVAGGLIVVSVFLTIVSYMCIISAILSMNSSEGRWRTFSTCSAHFVCVTVLYGTLVFVYGIPVAIPKTSKDRVASVFNTVIVPLLNPFIYSLRNQQVKEALKKLNCQT